MIKGHHYVANMTWAVAMLAKLEVTVQNTTSVWEDPEKIRPGMITTTLKSSFIGDF